MNGQNAALAVAGVAGQIPAGGLGPQFTPISALNLNRVWVIMRDNGCEGLEEPVAAYRDKLQADRAMSLLSAACVSFRCVEIEVW